MPVTHNDSNHTAYNIKYHIVWATKNRRKILNGNVAEKLKALLRKGCDARELTILDGSVSKDHVHLLISCKPSISPRKIARYLKGGSARFLHNEFPALRRYWGQRLWARGYFVTTVGNYSIDAIKKYVESIDSLDFSGKSENFKIEE
jgi:putative transposase